MWNNVTPENIAKINASIQVIQEVLRITNVPQDEYDKVKEIWQLEAEIRQLEEDLHYYESYVKDFNQQSGNQSFRGRGRGRGRERGFRGHYEVNQPY
ncbi:hypothetical protein KQX54_000093 [Cotesia glomerata]|uniref:Uncharacterized protein n=1 Tax=Cotesia glomerata TaxID=32391 RepID=A0AAV7HMY2_COTGL|nr:hypothetical protein KQX54_000093 [Cotesia glomerata]